MNPARLFVDEVARLGAHLTCDGDRLRLVPPAGKPLPPDLIARGRELKPALLELLRSDADQDRRDTFEERAAIVEHDGGLAHVEAEFLAAASVAPLMEGETIADRERVVIHFAEHLDRMRKTKGASNAC